MRCECGSGLFTQVLDLENPNDRDTLERLQCVSCRALHVHVVTERKRGQVVNGERVADNRNPLRTEWRVYQATDGTGRRAAGPTAIVAFANRDKIEKSEQEQDRDRRQ